MKNRDVSGTKFFEQVFFFYFSGYIMWNIGKYPGYFFLPILEVKIDDLFVSGEYKLYLNFLDFYCRTLIRSVALLSL
jgi:hypothetical protein